MLYPWETWGRRLARLVYCRPSLPRNDFSCSYAPSAFWSSHRPSKKLPISYWALFFLQVGFDHVQTPRGELRMSDFQYWVVKTEHVIGEQFWSDGLVYAFHLKGYILENLNKPHLPPKLGLDSLLRHFSLSGTCTSFYHRISAYFTKIQEYSLDISFIHLFHIII